MFWVEGVQKTTPPAITNSIHTRMHDSNHKVHRVKLACPFSNIPPLPVALVSVVCLNSAGDNRSFLLGRGVIG